MKLMLGFESLPYTGTSKIVRGKYQKSYGRGKTTTDISEMLEEHFKVVDAFFAVEEDYIIDLIEEQAAMDLDKVMMMQTVSKEGFSFTETDKIEARFRNDLTQRKLEMLTGRTKAADKEGRPSFVKSGLYRRSFRAWMEE